LELLVFEKIVKENPKEKKNVLLRVSKSKKVVARLHMSLTGHQIIAFYFIPSNLKTIHKGLLNHRESARHTHIPYGV
jgi:hypothetical protein